VLALLLLVSMIPIAVLFGRTISPWIIPGLMVFFLGFGAVRRVQVYEVMVEGGKEGFQVALRIIPYLVPYWWLWACCAPAAPWICWSDCSAK
jgi:hypothetical protein